MPSLSIQSLPENEVERLRPLAKLRRFAPYPYLRGVLGPETFTTYNLGTVSTLLQNGGKVFAAEDGDNLIGFVSYGPSPWESGVLNKRVGELAHLAMTVDSPEAIGEQLIRRACEEARNEGTELLSCKLNSGAIRGVHALETNGFRLMDALVEYVFDMRRARDGYLEEVSGDFNPIGLEVRPFEPADGEALMALSKAAFYKYYGRFHADPRIAPEDAIRFYEAWVRGSIEGYADWIDVATANGQVGGIVAWRWVNIQNGERTFKLAHSPLIFVGPKFQARGLFKVLAIESMRKLLVSADFGMGPTHINNYAMQSAFQKFHWWPGSSRFTFHKWLD